MIREFDERNMAKSRKVCESMAEAASTSKRVLSEREKLILDRWPKFEDGECVWFGDAYIDTDGDANKVRAIEFDDGCTDLVGIESFHTGFFAGERVKRPAPNDSWERFVEDMQKSACAYFGYQHKECDEGDGCPARGALDCSNRKMADLIRRAKALAGVEVGR